MTLASSLSGTPRVSIVTPCLNAEHFLEATVESVLSQDYPYLEYIVVDGGSTDRTLEILSRYQGRLRLIASPNLGAADAVNRGFAASNGDIFGYLNADDVYLPNAVSTGVRALLDDPDIDGVYGDAWWINHLGTSLAKYPVREFAPELLAEECFICQPASFVRRHAFEALHGLNPDFELTLDYEFWIRFIRSFRLGRIHESLAESRMHPLSKSLGRRRDVFRETFRLLQKYFGYVPFRWIYAYRCYQNDHRDQFFEPLEPSFLAYAESLPLGAWINRSKLITYLHDWASVMSWSGLWRQLSRGKDQSVTAVSHRRHDP